MTFPLFSRPARSSTVSTLIAAVWVSGFLALFFSSSIEDPDLKRSELLSMMADEVLGLSDVPPDPAHTASESGARSLSQRLPLFLWAALILAVSAVLGDVTYQLILRRYRLFWTEQVVIRLGTGMGILSVVTLCCGLLGQLNQTIIAIVTLLSLSLTCVLRWKFRFVASQGVTGFSPIEQRSSSIIRTLALLVIVPFTVYLLLGAVSPPTDFDVREYHLQGPKEWYQQGRITFLPHNVYTSFPFLTEMLSLTGMIFAKDWWRGALVGQIVLSVFQILSTLSVFSIARRWFSKDVAWLASLIYLTTPWTLRISLIAYAEGSLAFYLISSTMCALIVVQAPGQAINLSMIAGLLAGNAMASKYTGLISVIFPTAAVIACQIWRSHSESRSDSVPAIRSPKPVRPILLSAAAFSLGVTAMIAPWLLKNLVETGNPVYPLGYSVFGGSEWTQEMDARWKPAHAAAEHNLSRIPEHILGAAVYNKWTSGLLFGLAVPCLLLWRKNAAIPVVVSLICWGFASWWAFTHRIDRFWIPLIPLLSIAAGASWLISASGFWKSFLLTTVTAVTLFNVRFCGLALVGYHVGLMDLDAARQTTIRSDIRFLNESLPSDAKVLMVGEAEVFDTTFPLAYNTVFDDCLFEEWTTHPEDNQLPVPERRMLPPDQIRAALAMRKMTHIVVNWGEILRYRMPGSYGFTGYVQPSRFSELVAQNVLKPSRPLLARPWQSLSDTERRIVVGWNGYENLVRDNSSFSVVELYEIAQP